MDSPATDTAIATLGGVEIAAERVVLDGFRDP